MKMITAVKSCLFLALATLSFGASAHYCRSASCDPVYVGNPDRPDTIWVPGHYTKAGCWRDGYYVKFYRPVCNGEVVWNGDHYDYYRPYRTVRGEDVMYRNGCGHYYSYCGHYMKYKYKHHYVYVRDCDGYRYGYRFVNSEYYHCNPCMK